MSITLNTNELEQVISRDRKHKDTSNYLNNKTLRKASSIIQKMSNKSSKFPYFEDYVQTLMKTMKKEKFIYKIKKVYRIIRLVYYFATIILSLFSVILYILINEFFIKEVKMNLLLVELIISNIFLIELVWTFVAFNKRSFFLNLYVWIQIFTITFSYVSYFTIYINTNLSFLRILRCLLFVKIPKLMSKSNKFFTQIRKRLIKLIIIIASLIIINAAIVSIISIYDHRAFSIPDMRFRDSLYFVIITLFTVGTGDITPTQTRYRYVTLFMFLFLIYAMADRIANLVLLMRMTEKPLNVYFKNHIIVIGDINNPHNNYKKLTNFLDELFNEQDRTKMPHVIILFLDTTTDRRGIENAIAKYNWGAEKKVHYLLVDRYNYDVYKRVRFHRASYFFCLNHNVHSNYKLTDKLLAMDINFLYFLIKNFSKSKIQKFYTEFLYLDQSILTSSDKSVIELPFGRLKNDILIKSIFAKGFSTFITNWFIDHTISEENFEKINEYQNNYYLFHYLKSMNQTLLAYKLPVCLKGKKFKEGAQYIYKKSIEYKSVGLYKGQFSEIMLIGLICFGTTKHNDESFDPFNIDLVINSISYIKYNPSQQVIHETDFGIFITHRFFKSCFQDFISFLDNKQNEIEIEDSQQANPITNILIRHFNKTLTLNRKILNNYNNDTNNHSNRFFTQGLKENYKYLRDHIVICGFTNFIEQIICKIRVHSIYNTILIISEKCDSDICARLLRLFNNLVIVNGDYLDIDTLYRINIQYAYYALILHKRDASLITGDIKAVLCARLLDQYFKTKYIIELSNYDSIKYLGFLPISPDTTDNIITCKYIFPNFAKGNILFNTIIDKFIARAYTDPLQVICLKTLLEIDYKSYIYNVKKLSSENVELDIYLNSNIHIFSFRISKHYSHKLYQELVFDLFRTGLVPLGIYNEKFGGDRTELFNPNTCQTNHSNSFLRNSQIHSNFFNSIDKLINNEYCYLPDISCPLFITNPPHDLILNENMEVMVIGKFSKYPNRIKKLKRTEECITEVELMKRKINTIQDILNKLTN
jgi:hypothetical protein